MSAMGHLAQDHPTVLHIVMTASEMKWSKGFVLVWTEQVVVVLLSLLMMTS